MKGLQKVLTTIALFAIVAAFVPGAHAYYNQIVSSYGSTNNQYMAAYSLSPAGVGCHLVSAGGTLAGSEITVTTSAGAGNPCPAIGYDSVLDRFLVAWGEYDGTYSSYDIKGRVLSSNGTFVGDEIALGTSSSNQGTIKIAHSPSSGRYLVVFSSGTSGINEITGQYVDGNGSLYGKNFTAIPGATYAETPNVAYDSVNSRFLVAALTHGAGSPPMSVTGVILNDDISVFKSPFTILDSASYLYPPAIAFNPVASQYLVVWEVYTGSGHTLWGQLINADGTLSDTARAIVPSASVSFANDVVYQSDSGRFLVAWYGGDIYGQEVNSDGTNYGSEFSMVSGPEAYMLDLTYNSVSKNTLITYRLSGVPHFTTFPQAPTLTVVKAGTGTVTSEPAGISCGDGCNTTNSTFSSGQEVTLTASAGSNYAFGYWSGVCEGTLPSCTVTMTADLTVSVTFVPTAAKRKLLKVERVKVSGGDGTIQSHDSTINCGPGATPCKNSYYKDTPVSLFATAKEGSTFMGWKPVTLCPAADCTVIMSQARKVRAVFVGPQKLTASKHKVDKGNGSITSEPAGIECGTDCPKASYFYLLGEDVTLTAKADDASVFTGWSPARICTGTGDCIVTMDKAKSVTATFKGPQTLTVKKKSINKGSGSVRSVPDGIDCGETCNAGFTYNSHVTLSATADGGSTFTGWSPARICTGTGDCIVTMDKAKSVTAEFSKE